MTKDVFSKVCLKEINCCGCGSCFNSCPKKAIKMQVNEKGFLYPDVNHDLCTQCGLCLRKCPAYSNSYNYSKTTSEDLCQFPIIYAFVANQNVLNNSSSGGVFTCLANFVFEHNGVVAGAAFADEFKVEHIIIDNIKDLDKLRLSKYVQSNQNDIFKKVKEHLNNSRLVLYSGTPCQCAGLKSYLGKDYLNLITVDLLCHGVPSYQLLKDELTSRYDLNSIDKIYFRKKEGWSTCLDIFLKDGTIDSNNGKTSFFIRAFLEDLSLRESCYKCKFAKIPRVGDITIGDNWNGKKLKLGKIFETKSSIVSINSFKGDLFWNKALKKFKCSIKNIPNSKINKLNKNLTEPNAKRTKNIEIFWKNYFSKGYKSTMIDYSFNGNDNIGLVLYASNNYGSCATNYALYKVIESLGYKTIILDNLVPLMGISKSFLSNHCRITSSKLNTHDIKTVNDICKGFVLGSDYSLNLSVNHTKKNLQYFLMGFANDDKLKISWAPCLGIPPFDKQPDLKEFYKYYLGRLNFRTFREETSLEICKKYLNLDSRHVPDPVFLASKDTFINLNEDIGITEDFILVYYLDPTKEKYDVINYYSQQLKVKHKILFGIGEHNRALATVPKNELNNIIEPSGFEKFMSCFMQAKYVITDSFHGTCFAVLFNKPYISIKNRNVVRFDTFISLFKRVNIEHIPVYNSATEVLKTDVLSKDYNFEVVNSTLENLRNENIKLLNAALFGSINDSVPSESLNYFTASLFSKHLMLSQQHEQISKHNYWLNIINKVADVLPNTLSCNPLTDKPYLLIFINGVKQFIHYEFVRDKNNKLFFCIHCEDKSANHLVKKDFQVIAKRWKITFPNNFKLNKEIDLNQIHEEVKKCISDSFKIVSKYAKKSELKEK